jgi:hypothetical protein
MTPVAGDSLIFIFAESEMGAGDGETSSTEETAGS